MTAAADACRALADLGVPGVDAAAFAEELARRTAIVGGRGALRPLELALAWSCTHGGAATITAAIGYFERTYFAEARRALAKLRLSSTLADDVLGWMRFELFVRPAGPLLATYSGRGDLGSFVRAIAVREALKRARRSNREVSPAALEQVPMPDPQLTAMRGAYGAEFTRALADSFRALSTQDRNLLRQYFLDGLSIDVLAGLYKIHRATAARRVATARAMLVEQVRAALVRELALSESRIDEVITLSNLDESLGQLLRATA